MKKLFVVLLAIFITVLPACQPGIDSETAENGPVDGSQQGESANQEELTIQDAMLFMFTFTTYRNDNGQAIPMSQIFFSTEELEWDGLSFSSEFQKQGTNRHTTGNFDSDDRLILTGTLSSDYSMLETLNFTYEREGSIYEYNEIEITNIPVVNSSEENSFDYYFEKDISETLAHINRWRSGDINYDFVKNTEEVFESVKRLSDIGEISVVFVAN